MKKCPDCAEENLSESLFCKRCGRCLLSPDPEEDQRLIAVYPERDQPLESIDVYDTPIVHKPKAARPMIRHQSEFPVILGWLIVLNLLVFILISGIVIK